MQAARNRSPPKQLIEGLETQSTFPDGSGAVPRSAGAKSFGRYWGRIAVWTGKPRKAKPLERLERDDPAMLRGRHEDGFRGPGFDEDVGGEEQPDHKCHHQRRTRELVTN